MQAYLANPVYSALTTALEPFSLSNGVARRFQHGVIPFAGVPEPSAEALADLVPLLLAKEEIYLTTDEGETIDLPSGLEVVSALPGLQMAYTGPAPSDGDDAEIVALTPADVPEMLELKAVAFPGYFGPRAPELGRFYGIRDAKTGRLIAMGGERLATFTEKEISAVCTHPDYLGRGYATRLIRAVLRHQAAPGARSILHVIASNKRAISIYEGMGFVITGALEFIQLRRV
ncbi:GNAT family N-acetyltransferase [Silvibacterium acidisoli]|uniref:GNAT family N-acetyltransferase n=1 Tax=Acidobacteriaceae bacterium ZG23-2 TaxID=2883246 RepID=UPI00406CA144